jgi:hypothetical protein
LEPAQKWFHGPSRTTDLPRLRGLFDPCAASRRQRTAHVPVSRLRPPRSAENGSGNGLVKGRAAAADVGPDRASPFLSSLLYFCPERIPGSRVLASGRSHHLRGGFHAKCPQPQFRRQRRDPCGNRRAASDSALKRTIQTTTARSTFARLPECIGRHRGPLN